MKRVFCVRLRLVPGRDMVQTRTASGAGRADSATSAATDTE